MAYAAGDIVFLELDKYYVYALLGDDGKAFYIGMTNRPHVRLHEHKKSRDNSRLRARMDASKRHCLAILSEPLAKAEALELEAQLIAETPNLLNQEQRPDYRQAQERHPAFEKFMTRRVKTSET